MSTSAATQNEKLRIIIGDARNLASSRKLYCEVVILDASGQKITAPQKTAYHTKSCNPTWNQELEFDAPNFAGFVLTVWERHTIFPDKFLGIVTVRFNTKKYKPGDQILSDWFTLAKRKQNDTVSGIINITVIYGHKTKSTPKVEKKKKHLEEKDDKDVIGGGVKRDLRVSSKFVEKANELHDSGYVVVPEDVEEDSEEERRRKKRNRKSTKADGKGDTPADESKGSSESKTTESSDKSIKEIKKISREKRRSSSSNKNGSPASSPSLPKTRAAQVKLVVEMSKTNDSIMKEVVPEEAGSNIAFVLYNPKTDQESFVTLMLPDNIRRGEYMLFTQEGIIELGRSGSIMHAMNKVLKSFAENNGLESYAPIFPEPELSDDDDEPPQRAKKTGRRALMESVMSAASEVFDVEDQVIEGSDMGLENRPKGMDSIEKHINEYKSIHGQNSVGIATAASTLIVRLALDGNSFLNELMGDVWDLDLHKRIIIELELSMPYCMDSQTPPKVTLYQSSDKILDNKLSDRVSFGLQWYLQKRLENNWPPKHTHLFVDLVGHCIDKTLTCTRNCMICDKKLDFQMLKPSICDNPLCQFSYDEYGLGADIASMLRKEPVVVDLLINFTYAAASYSDQRRFYPYPFGVEVRQKKNGQEEILTFCTGKDKKNPNLIVSLLNQLPPIEELVRFSTTNELRSYLNSINPLLFPLLRWIITSNRAHIAELRQDELISGFGTKLQFLLLSTPPAKEKKFQELKQKHGSFWAFHGSGFFNWHAIVRCGLRNLSNTELMSTGAAYGSGIYLASESGTSIGYAGSAAGWRNSVLNSYRQNGSCESLQCLALCEVINAGYKANP